MNDQIQVDAAAVVDRLLAQIAAQAKALAIAEAQVLALQAELDASTAPDGPVAS